MGLMKRIGLIDKIFPKNKNSVTAGYFSAFTAYTPTFRTYNGGIYEMELTRASVHAFASLCGKLKPEVQGRAYKNLEKVLQFKPNPFMDTYKFIYRIATILSVDTTAFIVPLYGEDEKTIVGLYPLLPQGVEILDYQEKPWLRYSFSNGQKAIIELEKVGIMTNYQYKNDFFGDGNAALDATMGLLDLQNQGMTDAINQSAMIRFMARIGQNMRPEDIAAERAQFSTSNLSSENTTGVMMFDLKYADVKQIDSKPFVIDDKQMSLIQNNVYNYFGVNESILQNKYTEDEFNAFYEGKIEPFALQLSLVISNMLYTQKELAFGNQIIFTANRMQYASNKTKLEISTQLFDRGILTMNQVMDIWNMAHVEGGDERKIRGEYMDLDENMKKEGDKNADDAEPTGVQSTDPVTTEPGETEED